MGIARSGQLTEPRQAGIAALRWVTAGGVAADGGMTWPHTSAPGAPLADDLYYGTAGVLMALAECRLCGITEFDECGRAAAARLRFLAAADPSSMPMPAGPDGRPDDLNLGLYTGLTGCAAALRGWASVSGDRQSAAAAAALTGAVAELAAAGRPVSVWRDVLSGEAGIMLVLIGADDIGMRPGVSAIADRLAGHAADAGGLPDWHASADETVVQPNFSHGAAGIGFALAAAGDFLGRADLVDVAERAGRRLVALGSRQDGTLAVPHSIPLADPSAPVSYGWCHGPVGTLRLFELLDRLRPAAGWSEQARAARRAVRFSGLPARRYPGFWDNLGQCCGTAGVGELALDTYRQTGDPRWLEWAGLLAADVLDRRIEDAAGIRWSNTEHRQDPPELPPYLGWMHGAAGIAAWLLRLARVRRQGPAARKIRWPDGLHLWE